MKAVSQLVGMVLLALIRGYQLLVSPLLPPSCRYFPTCSDYARQAVAMHGPFKGTWFALTRILRCHPWGGLGYDPVPDPIPEKSTRAGISLGRACGCHHLDHLSGH